MAYPTAPDFSIGHDDLPVDQDMYDLITSYLEDIVTDAVNFFGTDDHVTLAADKGIKWGGVERIDYHSSHIRMTPLSVNTDLECSQPAIPTLNVTDLDVGDDLIVDGDIAVTGTVSQDYVRRIDQFYTKVSEPDDPADNQAVIWLSNATGYGDDRDLCVKITEASVTKSAILSLMNTPPVASNLDLTPSPPQTANTLTATYDYYDEDGDGESGSEIRWYKDTVQQGAHDDSATVGSGYTSKGEDWYFTIKPSDGMAFGTLQTSETETVINTPPVAGSVTLTPSSPCVSDDLVASYNYSDDDGDGESGTEIRWYKDTVLQSAYNDLTTLPSSATSVGDEWYYTVKPHDGDEFGTLQTSPTRTVVSKISTPRGVDVSGNYAYIADNGADALVVVDISTPASPVEIGAIFGTGGPNYLNGAYDVAVSGSYAYVVSGVDGRLVIIDISTPSKPSREGTISTGISSPMSVCLYTIGGTEYALVGTAGNRLTIIDVSTPSSPSYVDEYDLGDNGSDVAACTISGTEYAVVAADSAIDTYDISTPSSITYKDSLSANTAAGVYATSSYAYVADNDDDELVIVDISDPADMSQAGSISGSGSPNYLGGARGVDVSGSYAYIVAQSDDALTIINVSTPASPSHVGTISGAGNYLDSPRGVRKSGNYAYVAAYTSGCLTIIDVSTPAAPSFVAQLGA